MQKIHIPDFKIQQGPLSENCLAEGIDTFHHLLNSVWKMQYKRNDDFATLLHKDYGTCSTKHAFLSTVANENGFSDIKFECGIFEINENNFPTLSSVLRHNSVCGFLEAHCYLRYEGKIFDYTFYVGDKIAALIGPVAGAIPKFARTQPIDSVQIDPSSPDEQKIQWHKAALKSWCADKGLSFDVVWRAREESIEFLSKQS